MTVVAYEEEQILVSYLEWVRKHKAPKTYRRTLSDVKILKDMRVHYESSFFELSSQEIEDFLLERYSNPVSFNGFRGGLRRFYNYCVDQKLLAVNPIMFPRQKEPKQLPRPLTKTQQEKLLNVLKRKNLKWHFAVEVLINSGIRREELARLRISDFINNDGEYVLRVRSRTQGGGGKGDKERLIPITDSLITSFNNYLKEYRVDRGKNSWVFPGQGTRKMTFMNPESVRVYMKRLNKKLGFDVSPHRLRDTFASNHINAGTDIRIVQELLGHERITTTQKYTKVNMTAMRRAQERGTPLGEKDRLIKELTKKNREIENLKQAARDLKEQIGSILHIVENLEKQED